MIERHFEVPFVSRLALREKQIQQNYRPVIAVHKWFARRPGTLFRSLILSEFAEQPIHQTFYQSQHMPLVRVFDPFMGGGTTMMEANRVGCAVAGTDVNPMAWWIVRQELRELDVDAYQKAAEQLRSHLEAEIGPLYRTRCLRCRSHDAHVKYFLWVKTARCGNCHQDTDLFPNFLISEDVRHPTNVFVCRMLRRAFRDSRPEKSWAMPVLGKAFHSSTQPSATRPSANSATRLSGIQVHRRQTTACSRWNTIVNPCLTVRSGSGKGRLFKKPDTHDLAILDEAHKRLRALRSKFIPDDKIPYGDETARLHRWGYRALSGPLQR